jgi:hypothetical protein
MLTSKIVYIIAKKNHVEKKYIETIGNYKSPAYHVEASLHHDFAAPFTKWAISRYARREEYCSP